MLPLLLCIGAYSRSQAWEPYVYLLDKEPGPDTRSTVELVMMAAVSSTFSSLAPADSDHIEGPINNRSSKHYFRLLEYSSGHHAMHSEPKILVLISYVSFISMKHQVPDIWGHEGRYPHGQRLDPEVPDVDHGEAFHGEDQEVAGGCGCDP